MRAEERFPGIRLQLLHAQRKTAVGSVDLENHGLHQLALLHHFGGMLDALGPGKIGNVHQPVDAFFDFDERAEIGELAHAAFHHRADGE